MDPYERMTQVANALEPRLPPEERSLVEALRQSILHANSSLVTLTLLVIRDKPKLGEGAVTFIYLIRALEAARTEQFTQMHQFLLAAERLLTSGGR